MSRSKSTQKSRKMRDLLRQLAESDESQRSFASRHGVSVSTLKYWRKQLQDDVSFLPVELEKPLSVPASTHPIVIRYPHGIEVQVPADWSVEQIRTLCEPHR